MPAKAKDSQSNALIAAMTATAQQTSRDSLLIDIPYQYLVEKSQWSDFKRSLNMCGLTWNLARGIDKQLKSDSLPR